MLLNCRDLLEQSFESSCTTTLTGTLKDTFMIKKDIGAGKLDVAWLTSDL